ncbi:helix-turn-helix domain-containing protein [Bacillus thuringiensis]|nr:helix-turn-helix domain-containing protein [Bacillus thuringiensis]MED3528974.1 helix-turn-helix domain-containing protein [Bacillus thuringiensis]MED3620499.1 helix-turn-helix domain-containing protein [Bacillus thuringiensis]
MFLQSGPSYLESSRIANENGITRQTVYRIKHAISS